MSASTSKEIRDLIKTKLEDLQVGGDDAFGEVFDYANAKFSEYPVAVVRAVGGRGNVIDTHRNERIFSFVIELYQEQSKAGKTASEADQIMIDTADAVVIAFDQDKDLGGEIEIVRVVDFDFSFKVAAGTFNYATIKVDALVIVPNWA